MPIAPLPHVASAPGTSSGNKAGAKARSQSPSPQEVAAAGADAQYQVAAAEKTVSDARAQADAELDRLSADYDVREEAEINRRDAALANEQLKGYEALRDLQQKQQEELSHLHREGERSLADMKDYYHGTLTQTQREAEQQLRDTRTRGGIASEAERMKANEDLEVAQHGHVDRVARIQESNDEQEKRLIEGGRSELERARTSTAQSAQKAQLSFDEKTAAIRSQTDEELGALAMASNRELANMRSDTSMKLDAYANRQRDPFYRLVDTGAELSETDEGYELRALIPPHEREHLSVSISGNELVLSGYRRNEEKRDLEPGRSESTSAFQSFRETFPLPLPVNAKALNREFDGDQLIVRVPKSPLSYVPPKPPPIPARVKVERPAFPKNLPIEPPKDDEDPRITEARARARAQRPLS